MFNDVFISYAHNDNLTPPGENEGWVTNFRDSLAILLNGYIGGNAKVWRDQERMRGGDFLTPTLKDSLRTSLTMISIISPSYMNSEWCQKELEFFCDAVGSQIGNRSRVFFVVKLPAEQLPARFNDLLRFEFFEQERSDFPSTLSPYSDKFKKKIEELAYTIHERLREIKAKPKPGKTIYLAETTGDMRSKRRNVRDDFSQRDFTILPSIDEDKPSETEDYKASVREDIKKCDLAVHIVGRNYGDCPPDSNLSYVHLQTIVAAERDNDANFSRLIWLPEDLQQQPDFLQELLISAKTNVDVFRDPLVENLKTRIQDILDGKLKKPVNPPPGENGNSGLRPNVYVFCEQKDKDGAKNLESYLIEKLNCETFSGSDLLEKSLEINNQDEYFGEHKRYLEFSNGALIYWKTPRLRNWVQAAVMLLGKKIDYTSLGVYVDDEVARATTYNTGRAQILRNSEDLSRFVSSLRLKLEGSQNAV